MIKKTQELSKDKCARFRRNSRLLTILLRNYFLHSIPIDFSDKLIKTKPPRE